MRPYMLWLTKAYAGWALADALAAPWARQALSDWVAWQNEQRFYVDGWRA